MNPIPRSARPWLRSIGAEFPWWFLPLVPVFAIATLAMLFFFGLGTVWPWWRRWA